MSGHGCLLLLLLMACGLLQCTPAAAVRAPTLPRPITGRPSCLQPIKALKCQRDTRSKFVAGVSTSYGSVEGFGFRDVCNDAGVGTYYVKGTAGEGIESFDMSVPEGRTFPKTAAGGPDMRYFYPYGSLITQMVVLQAPNPWGSKFGHIAAIIFAYYNDDGRNGTSLDFAVCGNADYASSYLSPGEFPRSPTIVSLQAQFTNPLSEELPQRYLSTFDGFCGLMGRGYLYGDPNTISKNQLKRVTKACFAKPAIFVQNPGAPVPPPLKVIRSSLATNKEEFLSQYKPCHFNKRNTKSPGASFSCVANGYAVATGKYGVISLDTDTGSTVGWDRDEKTGTVTKVDEPEWFDGTHKGESKV